MGSIGLDQFFNKKFMTIDFNKKWEGFIGLPERKGSWFIWGNSGNGKTAFAAQIAKYLSSFERVAYNSLEEGVSKSLREAFINAGINKHDKILLLDKEPIGELIKRLEKPKSPNIIIIDSLQFSWLTKTSYKSLVEQFPKKLFIFISHAEGKKPAGRTANSVHYDASVKIWIEGFRAHPKSRYGGGETYTIWETGSELYWNK